MDPKMWARLEALFFQLLALDPEERGSFLDRECAGEDALRAEVEAVLASHQALAGADPLEVVPEDRVGAVVGPYRLEELVGRGGMGEVYRARRSDHHYEQEVAVKLVRSGLPPHELARRFRMERQILARLQHPNLATLLDGGVTVEGLPYLVMQYVRGGPITEYADRRRLSIAQRLRLFVTVCRAVQYAHMNLVVHRDLKPSNILVTDEGEVRLLDFGIAKLLDPEGIHAGDIPTESLLFLTPEHAAPEQFLGLPITTATDVYQLGVLLYELLTSSRPFQAGTSHELHRAICQEEPTRPSAAPGRPGVAGGGPPGPATEADAARDRSSTPEALRRLLQGDLDRITLMALRKDPGRRYTSAADLADDIQRHLEGYPVRARPETFGYLAGRFVRRHRLGVAAGLGLSVSLMALVVLSLRFAGATSEHAALIAQERDVALQISSFMEELFAAGDPFSPGAQRRDTLRLRDFLDQGAWKVQEELGDQPLVQARLLTVLGRAYRNLGRFDDARPLLDEALAIRSGAGEVDAGELAVSRLDLALLLLDQGERGEAESLLRSSLEVLEGEPPTHRRWLASAHGVLGNVLQADGRYGEAEASYRRALALAEGDPDTDDGRFASHLSNLATVLIRQARYPESEALLLRAVSLSRRQAGDRHPTTATMLNNLGNLFREQEKLDEAEAPFREALAIRRELFPPPHPAVAVSVNNLADLLLAKGDQEGAEALFRESLELRRAIYGEDHPSVGTGWLNLGAVLQLRERSRGEALEAYTTAGRILRGILGPRHPQVGGVEGNLGRLQHDVGDHRRALVHYQAALEIRREGLDAAHPLVLGNLSDLGRCLMELGRYPEAEAFLLEAYAGLEPQGDAQPRLRDGVLLHLARLYAATGRHEEAARFEAMRSEPNDGGE